LNPEVLATTDGHHFRVPPRLPVPVRYAGATVPGESAMPGPEDSTGPVADQAALHGLLNRVADLGLVLVSVCRLDPG
jgi:hypothetical protein